MIRPNADDDVVVFSSNGNQEFITSSSTFSIVVDTKKDTAKDCQTCKIKFLSYNKYIDLVFRFIRYIQTCFLISN